MSISLVLLLLLLILIINITIIFIIVVVVVIIIIIIIIIITIVIAIILMLLLLLLFCWRKYSSALLNLLQAKWKNLFWSRKYVIIISDGVGGRHYIFHKHQITQFTPTYLVLFVMQSLRWVS